MEIYLILIFTLFYVILAWRRLDWTVLAMIIGLPLYQIRFKLGGIPFTVLEIMILISFTVWVINSYKKIISNFKFQISNPPAVRAGFKFKTKIRYPFDLEIFALLLVSWIAIAISGMSDSALGIWKAYFFEPMLVYILVVNVFSGSGKSKKDMVAGPSPCQGGGQEGVACYKINKLIWALTFLSFWISLIAVFQRFGIIASPENFWPRVTGPFTYPNALGLLLSPIILIMTTWFLKIGKEKKTSSKITLLASSGTVNFPISLFQKLFLLLTILMSVSAISLARSEGAAVGVIIAMVIVGLMLRTKKTPKLMWLPKSLIALIIGGVLTSSVFFLHIVPEYKYFNFDQKIYNYITDKAMLKDISGEIRKQQWRETWQVLTESPKNFIFGVGLSGYQTAVKPYHQEGIFFNFERDEKFRDKIVWFDEEYKAKHWQPVEIYMYPHNFFLNFWIELGLLGALLFIWIFIKFLIISFKLIERDPKNRFLLLGGIGAMIVMIVHGIVDVPYFKNDIAVLFWIIMGLLGIIIIETKQNKKTEL